MRTPKMPLDETQHEDLAARVRNLAAEAGRIRTLLSGSYRMDSDCVHAAERAVQAIEAMRRPLEVQCFRDLGDLHPMACRFPYFGGPVEIELPF